MVDWLSPSALPDPPKTRAEVEQFFETEARRLGDRMAVALTDVVRRAYERYLASLPPTESLTAAGDFSAFDEIPGEWDRIVKQEVEPAVVRAHATGGISAWVRSGIDGAAVPSFAGRWASVVNQSAVDYVASVGVRIGGIGQSLRDDLVNAVSVSLKKGLSNEQLKDQTQAVLGSSEFRADVVARTEIAAAYNGGNYAGAVALGPSGPVEKVWVATLDKRTRKSHFAINDQYVAMSAPFQVGGYPMQHPLDPKGPAKEVVQCRCYLELLFPGDARPDGTRVPESAAPPVPPPTPPPPPPPPPAPPTPRRTPTPRPKAPPKPKTPRRPPTPRAPQPTAPVRPPRVDPPEAGYDTWAEAEAYLKARHPQVIFDPVDFATYDRRTVRDIIRWADESEVLDPDAWASMGYVGSQTTMSVIPSATGTTSGQIVTPYRWAGQSHYAHAYKGISETGGRGVIAVNPKYARDWDLFARQKASGRRSGWTFGDSPLDTLHHEFGHIRDGFRINRRVRTAVEFGLTKSGSLVVDGVDYGSVPFGEIDDLLVRFPDTLRKKAKNNIEVYGSRYGSKNESEAYAESYVAKVRRDLNRPVGPMPDRRGFPDPGDLEYLTPQQGADEAAELLDVVDVFDSPVINGTVGSAKEQLVRLEARIADLKSRRMVTPAALRTRLAQLKKIVAAGG